MPQEERQQRPRIPELELSVAIRILKDRYGVFIEPVKDKPYYVRFKQLSSGKTIQGMTHAKGTMLNPRFIIEILERFDIDVREFLDELTDQRKRPQAV